jgi:hypothetical protein
MSENDLNRLHINDLLDVMVKSMNELLAINKAPQNNLSIKLKQKEVELIQKVIVTKRAELQSG